MSAATGPQLRLWMLIPALGATMVLAVFLLGLSNPEDRDRLPSALIGSPVPAFSLPGLLPDTPGLSDADLRVPGIKLVNIWASWCGPCRVEHPQILALAASGIPVHGLNYKDAPDAARGFLEELGNPYTLIGTDRSGRTGIEWGVYGVPETFVIDGKGMIRYRHVGPILARDMEKIEAAMAAAREGE